MNYLLILAYGYVVVAALLIYFIARDRKNPNLFFGKNKFLSLAALIILSFGIVSAFYATLVEPYMLLTTKIDVRSAKMSEPIKIAFVSDIQLGKHKKVGWAEKVAQKIEAAEPDAVVFGGDLIENGGTFEDESVYLEPFKKIAERFPSFYVLGNHEYGIGSRVRTKPEYHTGDRSALVIERMKKINVTLLRNSLTCPEIKNQKICFFGMDDVWKNKPNFSDLKNWNRRTPLVFLTHNPDGIMYWPPQAPLPDLIIAGHTHAGQVWIPFWGPLGKTEIDIGDEYTRGLNTWRGVPIYVTSGAGESGGPLRYLAWPEVAIVTLEK